MPYEVIGSKFQEGPPSPQQVTVLLNQGEANGWQLVEIVVGSDFLYVIFRH
jgi:hypothetical protein